MSVPLPESALVLTSVAVVFLTISNLLTRRLVDLDAERRIKAEINEYTRSLRAAMKAKDKALEEKLKKKESSINQMRLKMSSARSKIALYTLIPFIAGYYLVIYFIIGGPTQVAVYSPFFIPYIMTHVSSTAGAGVYSWSWYFLSSLTFSGAITRLLKTQT